MAKVEAPKVEEAVTPETPSTDTGAFILSDVELKAVARKGGREAAPSLYLEEVRGQIGSDKAMGIPVAADTKGTKVMSELRKAAKQLGVHVRIWDRSGDKAPEGTKPFVGFKVIDKPADPAEVHVSEHGQPDGNQ
jgi:hypothetical protein